MFFFLKLIEALLALVKVRNARLKAQVAMKRFKKVGSAVRRTYFERYHRSELDNRDRCGRGVDFAKSRSIGDKENDEERGFDTARSTMHEVRSPPPHETEMENPGNMLKVRSFPWHGIEIESPGARMRRRRITRRMPSSQEKR